MLFNSGAGLPLRHEKLCQEFVSFRGYEFAEGESFKFIKKRATERNLCHREDKRERRGDEKVLTQ